MLDHEKSNQKSTRWNADQDRDPSISKQVDKPSSKPKGKKRQNGDHQFNHASPMVWRSITIEQPLAAGCRILIQQARL
jgi:hypothetical protein